MSTLPPSDTPWTDALAVDALPTDDVIGVTVAGRDLALYTVEGAVYATDNLCTHGNARLCDGFLEGHEIECPLHQGRFDVRDGRPLCEPVTAPLRSYPVKIETGRVWLQIG
jgi:naphthalene 1,2-dioxygenase system ferredoxin subunit